MKRWAVFELVTYYPCGGMGDFIAAFDTQEDAETFIENSLNSEYWTVEDMQEYLDRPSPKVPTKEDLAAAIAEENRKNADWLASMSPMDREMHESMVRLMQKMNKGFFGGGK